MTQHVRTGYRRHRKATLAMALGIVALIAVAVIPLATGAPSKFYALEVPTSLCSVPTSQELTLKLVNKTRNQNLGSANITAPAGITLTEIVSVQGAGSAASWTLNVPDSFSSTGNTIRLRNLVLPTVGSAATIKVKADITAGGTWAAIVKQSNSFADSGPGNLFAAQGGPFTTSVVACESEYVFVDGPDDAERGSAQTVVVELRLNGTAVPASGELALSALQGVADATSSFSGLTAQGSGTQWTFSSVIGNVSGSGYALQAGDTVSAPTFTIADGLCQPFITDPEHVNSSCSLSSNLNGGILESGVTINNHNLQPIAINFVAGSTATGKCDPWIRASYTVGGQPYYLPGVELDFDWGGGMLKVIYRVRNTHWVLTEASRGNADIEICAGARHGIDTHLNKDEADGGDPFAGKYGNARWDDEDGLFWGVLGTVSNPSKVKPGGDPAVCGRGGQDLATGPGGALENWRTWTICIPSDWDWKNFG